MAAPDTDATQYIDYETFLDPDFSPVSFANSLIVSTNDPSDPSLDLTTPLSRVLFDVQEIDTLIDSLTTKSALPLLEYTSKRQEASEKLLGDVEKQVATLSESYKVLEKELLDRYEGAEQVRVAAERLLDTVRVARSVARVTLLGRQLEVQMGDVEGSSPAKGESSTTKRADHRAMIRAANTLLSMRDVLSADQKGQEDSVLDRVDVIKTLKTDLLDTVERNLIGKSQQILREFSISSLLSPSTGNSTSTLAGTGTAISTYSQSEDMKARTTSAILTLYTLSTTANVQNQDTTEPMLLISALKDTIETYLKASLASLARSLATLPTLDKTLQEISARCQNLLALELLLSVIRPPPRPDGPTERTKSESEAASTKPGNLLDPLLNNLDTSSLPSYFWRTLASNLSPRVREIMTKGGVSARTLKSNRDRVRDAIRACVDRGSRLPTGAITFGSGVGGDGSQRVKEVNWEREAAVMVSAVVNVLGR